MLTICTLCKIKKKFKKIPPDVFCIIEHVKLLILFLILTDILFFSKLHKICISLAVNDISIHRHSGHILIQILDFRQLLSPDGISESSARCFSSAGSPVAYWVLLLALYPCHGMPYSFFVILHIILVANSPSSSPYSLSIFPSGGGMKNTQKFR